LQKREGGERDKEGIRQVGFCGGDFKKGRERSRSQSRNNSPVYIYIYIYISEKKTKGKGRIDI
jgi:hypothetical protein